MGKLSLIFKYSRHQHRVFLAVRRETKGVTDSFAVSTRRLRCPQLLCSASPQKLFRL